MKKRILVTGSAVLVLMSVFIWFTAPKQTCSAVSPCTASVQKVKELINQKENLIVLDVRTPDEYTQGHLAASTLLPLDTLNEKIESIIPDKNTPIVVYCRTGRRSAEAYNILMSEGYTDVTDMSGGINAWVSAGYPIAK